MTAQPDTHAAKAFTIRRFTEAYSISRAKTYRLIESGEIDAVKVGSRTLIPAKSADAWFASLPRVAVAR